MNTWILVALFSFDSIFYFFCPVGQLSVCERERIEALKIVENNTESGSQDFSFYIPKCDNDGRFEEVQCLSPGTKCWCVDRETGKEVGGIAIPGISICQKSKSYFVTEYFYYL